MASPIAWRLATVGAVRDETPTVRSFTLASRAGPAIVPASTSTCG